MRAETEPPTASRMEIVMARRSDRMDTIVSLCKRRGIVFPSSEIYGGLRASWDYGPLGVEMKNNIKRQWWRTMVQEREDIVGLDSSVILAREVWEASGHVTEFTDPLTECIFISYRNVLQASRKKIPFGIGQIGKSFRNEITPGNCICRTREFEQMEMEFFVKPGTDEEWHE